MTIPADGTTGTWLRYADQRRGFALEHPSDWDVQPRIAGLLVAVAAPPGDGISFRANLNVVRKTGIKTVELDDLARIAIRELTRVLTDLNVLDIEATVISGTPARRLLFSYRQGIFGLTAEQWLFYAGEGQWTVSAAASADEYDTVADVFAGTAASLEISGG